MGVIMWSTILDTDSGDRVTLTRGNGGAYSLLLAKGKEAATEIDLSADDLTGLAEMFKQAGAVRRWAPVKGE